MSETSIDLKVSKTWHKIAVADSRTYVDQDGVLRSVPAIFNQGGTSSGKTYGTLKHLIFKYGINGTKSRTVELFRKNYSDLEGSLIRDFFEILDMYQMYEEKNHRKSQGKVSYTIYSKVDKKVKTTYYFKGLDDRSSKVKKRGPRRNIAYMNELNDFNLDDYIQISARTKEKVYADFNPSHEFWLHEKYLDHDERIEGQDYILLKTTYKDNVNVRTGKSFLPAKQVKEIEDLIKIDDYYYKVYVLGELAVAKGLIYKTELFEECTEEFFHSIKDYDCEQWFSIDWGYEHHMVFMHFKYHNERIYVHVPFCRTEHYDDDLIRFISQEYKDEYGNEIVDQSHEIYCDSAGASSINKLKDAGYFARKADKTVEDGIRFCQGIKRIVTDTSKRHKYERKKYKWKQDSSETVHVGKPVKIDDDNMDCERYGLYSHLKRRREFGTII